MAAALHRVGGKHVGHGQHNFYPASKKELTFSTIRNPYDVLATWFELQRESGYPTMAEFLFKYHHSEFTRDGRLFYFEEVSDVLLCYDRLQEEFNKLLVSLHLGHERIYRINTTPNKKPFMDYYAPSTIGVVEELYKKDLECYRVLRGPPA